MLKPGHFHDDDDAEVFAFAAALALLAARFRFMFTYGVGPPPPPPWAPSPTPLPPPAAANFSSPASGWAIAPMGCIRRPTLLGGAKPGAHNPASGYDGFTGLK